MEEQFDQFERFGDQIDAQIVVLTEQFATMGGANERCCQPNSCFVEKEDEYSVEDESLNLFGERRTRILVPN